MTRSEHMHLQGRIPEHQQTSTLALELRVQYVAKLSSEETTSVRQKSRSAKYTAGCGAGPRRCRAQPLGIEFMPSGQHWSYSISSSLVTHDLDHD